MKETKLAGQGGAADNKSFMHMQGQKVAQTIQQFDKFGPNLNQYASYRQMSEVAERDAKEEVSARPKAKSFTAAIKEGWNDVKKGLKVLSKEARHAYSLKRQHGGWHNMHLDQFLQYKRISYDVTKFMPYSLFLVVPFSSLVLPFYLLLLPNAVPSQFRSEQAALDRKRDTVMRQAEGYGVLKKRLRAVFGDELSAIDRLVEQIEQDPANMQARRELEALDMSLQKRLRDDWASHLSASLGYYQLTAEEKEALLKVFSIEYISGVFMVNQLYNLPLMLYNLICKHVGKEKVIIDKQRWKFNFFPFKELKALGYRTQLLGHFKRIGKEDYLLHKGIKEELGRCSTAELEELVRKRGFNIGGATSQKQLLEEYWPQSSKTRDVDAKIWSIVLRQYYIAYLLHDN